LRKRKGPLHTLSEGIKVDMLCLSIGSKSRVCKRAR
jgi:hypothetical protein